MQEIARTSVFFIIPTLTLGGAERVIITLLKHFDRSRFRLTIGVVDTRNEIYRKEIPSDVEFIDLGFRNVRYAIPKIINLIWKLRPNVVFSTVGHLNLALAVIRPLLPSGIRCIARETSMVSHTLQVYRYPFVWTLLYKWFYKQHDLIVCQSREMQEDLIRNFNFPRNKLIIINNPIDLKFMQIKSAEPLENIDFDEEIIWLVTAGRLSEVKGYDILIQSIALLNEPRIRLSILGEGPLLDELKQLAKEKGVTHQIEFVGLQTNPFAWFARAGAFVLSSRHEGFPNAVLEALACGTPVIATPAPGGLLEIIGEIPECFVAAQSTPEALAKAISAWVASPKTRVLQSVVAPYSTDLIIRKYENIMTSVECLRS